MTSPIDNSPAPESEGRASTLDPQHAERLLELGHLVASVAHEINNPLSVLELGLRELLDAVGPECKELVAELQGHTDRITRIVSNLHLFAEPREPEFEALLVRDLIRAARKIARNTLGSVIVQVDLIERDLEVFADRRQVEQVLVNLLTNGARAMDGRGHIRVEGRANGHTSLIRVIDAGPGIAPEVADQLFKPFVRRGGAESVHMGLGLSISWGIMQANAGSIRASRDQGGGACFELELPRPNAQPAPRLSRESPPDSRLPAALPARVLCVEDEAVLRRTLLRLLEVLGHTAVGVASAEEAIERLEVDSYDVLITDLRLPGMSGEELCQKVAVCFPEMRQRTIIMSGFFRSEDAKVNFLQKPFSAVQLQRALALAVARGDEGSA